MSMVSSDRGSEVGGASYAGRYTNVVEPNQSALKSFQAEHQLYKELMKFIDTNEKFQANDTVGENLINHVQSYEAMIKNQIAICENEIGRGEEVDLELEFQADEQVQGSPTKIILDDDDQERYLKE